MSKETPMIQAETVRYEAVARILSHVRDTLDDMSPVLEARVITCLMDRPDMPFEEVVTEVVKDCVNRQDILRGLA